MRVTEDDERVRQASRADRAGHAPGSASSPDVARRAAAVHQRPDGRNVGRRAAPARGRAQRAVPHADPRIHAAPQGEAGHHRLGQVNGWRGETDTLEKMIERVAHDIEYIRRYSFFFDLKIIFLTVFGRRARTTPTRRHQKRGSSMAEIRDGDAYSITIADDARPCIVSPPASSTRRMPEGRQGSHRARVNPDSRSSPSVGARRRTPARQARALETGVVTATPARGQHGAEGLRCSRAAMAEAWSRAASAPLRSGPDYRASRWGVCTRRDVRRSGLSDRARPRRYASWSRRRLTLTLMTAPVTPPSSTRCRPDRRDGPRSDRPRRATIIDSATASGASRESSASSSSPPSCGHIFCPKAQERRRRARR